MEINASIPHIKVNISDYEANTITLSVISKKFGISKHSYIDNHNWLCEDIEVRSGSHSSFDTEKIREATKIDLAVVEVLKHL